MPSSCAVPCRLDVLGIDVVDVDARARLDARVASAPRSATCRNPADLHVLADHRDVDLARRDCSSASTTCCHSRRSAGGASRPQLVARRSRRGPARAAASGSCRCRRRRRPRSRRAPRTLVKSAILRRCSSGSGGRQRHSSDVGLDADPAQLLHRVLRRLGLDLARRRDVRAPASGGCSTTLLRPSSTPIWRIASRNGSDSMSPTVPPISTMPTSASPAPSWMQRLISSVMCGITCTVPPR